MKFLNIKVIVPAILIFLVIGGLIWHFSHRAEHLSFVQVDKQNTDNITNQIRSKLTGDVLDVKSASDGFITGAWIALKVNPQSDASFESESKEIFSSLFSIPGLDFVEISFIERPAIHKYGYGEIFTALSTHNAFKNNVPLEDCGYFWSWNNGKPYYNGKDPFNKVEQALPIKQGEKRIFLTFDDGPFPLYSLLLADLIRHYGHATFFLVGKMLEVRPYIGKILQDWGIEIGYHSEDHYNFNKLDNAMAKDEITLETATFKAAGLDLSKIKWFRPPGGDLDSQKENLVKDLGLKVAWWNVNTADYKKETTREQIASSYLSGLKDGNVFLGHQGLLKTIQALEVVLPIMKSKGYSFESL
ncbi:Peptidoglycan/xylan/chitin deacetylase, PgdA/CDA1 family [Thermodesulfobium acidiphilum]|uniref:Peptidoglycan/xylan/chitin deacetylase, PgdA/CDA1 family n=1 Tax=Thermodesulfobium acidiphilum TaxID=1794699 RepID=A0A2R4VYI1_THEAF|nr:polysaccharide deacetylase family protein [Thermodesulfobium acidiphilum]AWB09524.1 Peptidoglycan/xylan/chitin deacetylase, PgdA/CDA1 family [Thermodesulfobium acidiphilum]